MLKWINDLFDNKKWEKIHISLTNSFANIKKDIEEIRILHHTKREEHDLKISELQNRIIKLETRLENFFSFYNMSDNQQKEDYDLIILPEDLKAWDSLTSLQQNMFKKLCQLLNEDNNKVKAIQELSKECYPHKEYKQIRSLVSSYTDRLEEIGLLKKIRRGRKTYLILTKKGEKHKKIILKQLKEEGIID